MPQADVEIVRRAYDAYRRRDATPLASLLHPEVEWRLTSDPAPVRGVEAVARSAANWFSSWEEESVEVEELLESGEGRVIAVVRNRGRGKSSGVEVEARFFQLWTLREGRIVAFREFTTREEALQAAADRSP